jgi:CheY-like chemotaxis protein
MKPPPVCFLIDDDLDDQEIFLLAWKQIDPSIECVYANDGIYGLEKLHKESLTPNLIFIDINMPRMSGIDVLKEIKKITRLQKVPVYMYSTAADPAIIMECKRLGAEDFIKKAPTMSELEHALANILSSYKLSLSNYKRS